MSKPIWHFYEFSIWTKTAGKTKGQWIDGQIKSHDSCRLFRNFTTSYEPKFSSKVERGTFSSSYYVAVYVQADSEDEALMLAVGKAAAAFTEYVKNYNDAIALNHNAGLSLSNMITTPAEKPTKARKESLVPEAMILVACVALGVMIGHLMR